MLGLSPRGIVYYDTRTGELTEKQVDPASAFGQRVLIEQYGCIFANEEWSRPEL